MATEVYAIRRVDNHKWVTWKIVDGNPQEPYKIQYGKCQCVGYKFHGTCRHIKMAKAERYGDSIPLEIAQKAWMTIMQKLSKEVNHMQLYGQLLAHQNPITRIDIKAWSNKIKHRLMIYGILKEKKIQEKGSYNILFRIFVYSNIEDINAPINLSWEALQLADVFVPEKIEMPDFCGDIPVSKSANKFSNKLGELPF